MKITQMYMYPIKSLRGTSMGKTIVTKTGFPYDRRFMLLRAHEDLSAPNGQRLENMAVASFNEMTLFFTDVRYPKEGDLGEITVTFRPPNAEEKAINIPLQPDTNTMSSLDVTMHGSYTKAYAMADEYNEWFSSCFEFPVVFAYLGEHLRPVLMSTSGNAQPVKSAWLSSITSYIPTLGSDTEDEPRITFADCAPFLVVTEDSLHQVSAKLPEGEDMDITKYRPNIVLSATDKAWDEDFWAEIQVGRAEDGIRIPLPHNCVRCRSINIDYATGKQGTGKSGEVLKLMQKDRRVDKLKKYSPVFGRYGFLSSSGEGKEVAVGDEVTVTKRNREFTGFDWPGI